MVSDLQRHRRGTTPAESESEERAVVAGLDALESTAQLPPKPGLGRVLVRSVLPPVVFLALLVGVWQLAFMAEVKPPYALPSPAHVWDTFTATVQDGRAGSPSARRAARDGRPRARCG